MGLIDGDGTIGLRPLRPEDADAHLAGCDVLINERLGGGADPRREDVVPWLERNAAAWAARGDVVDLGVVDLATGELTGSVGIQRGLGYLRDGEVNLTYALYPRWRGRGYAARAVRLAMEVATSGDAAAVARFVIRVAPDNAESAAVARRCGFTPAGSTDDEHGRLDWYERAPRPD